MSRSKSRVFSFSVVPHQTTKILSTPYFLLRPLMNPGMINFLFYPRRNNKKNFITRCMCVCVGNPLSVSHDVFLKGLRASLVVTTSPPPLSFNFYFPLPFSASLCVWDTAVCQSEKLPLLTYALFPLYAFLEGADEKKKRNDKITVEVCLKERANIVRKQGCVRLKKYT